MCGIIGYIGKRDSSSVLLHGLKRMEYRGYDSAGLAAVLDDGSLFLKKKAGKIDALREELRTCHIESRLGIGHTRWATHGEPSRKNAHPFVGCGGRFAIAHNGIIENYQALRQRLIEKGCEFTSDTDSEVIVHLVESHYNGDFYEAVRLALRELWGALSPPGMEAR